MDFTKSDNYKYLLDSVDKNKTLKNNLLKSEMFKDFILKKNIFLQIQNEEDLFETSFRLYFTGTKFGLSIASPLHNEPHICELMMLYDDELVCIKKIGYNCNKIFDDIDDLINEISFIITNIKNLSYVDVDEFDDSDTD